ncbi:hypothetical protein SYK_05180 [Pseudodesulfovibrio nedwellii]|uniref:Uncharacterized protein n=1 Tax=Pseudodesulfovibrio nedwellii TaxID=2973072 RepID=A0ABM8AXV9_9BACT|nr:hypothetical protein [Pseudodesulfovibrio nedwellii]BDQ36158.1 hypothetical protein SYK_05180 [Pseudodesulfovibrio nedwellii]
MGKMKKRITVRFFSIDADSEFFNDFIAIHQANQVSGKPVRVFNVRDKKHFIKIHDEFEYRDSTVFFLSVVRERYTWQAKALSDGTISGISLNQGIIGDPYYYFFLPDRKILMGFTTGPSASVRSVANTVLQQFKKDRTAKVFVEPISKEQEYARIKDLVEFSEVRFSVNPASLTAGGDELPSIFKGLRSSPFMANSSRLELTISDFGDDGFSQENLLDAVDYLSDNECCTTLIVRGLDAEGESHQLNLNRAYLSYSTSIKIRDKFVGEKVAKKIIQDAFSSLNGL